MKNAVCIGCHVLLPEESINEMKEQASEIKLEQFRACTRPTSYQSLIASLYYRKDWTMRYYKSTFEGIPCVYLVDNTGVVHVFCEVQGQTMTKFALKIKPLECRETMLTITLENEGMDVQETIQAVLEQWEEAKKKARSVCLEIMCDGRWHTWSLRRQTIERIRWIGFSDGKRTKEAFVEELKELLVEKVLCQSK